MTQRLHSPLRRKLSTPRKMPKAVKTAVLNVREHIRRAGLASVSTLLALQTLGLAQSWAQTAPRIPTNSLPSGNTQRTGTPIKYTTSGNTGTITQTDSTNIVNWQTFDIGSAATLNIVQPSSSSVLLNNVAGGAFQNKTLIEGVLNANGHVYLYNANGIIFGKKATVNVNTLIASTLQFNQSSVTGGLLLQPTVPVLSADTTLAQRPGAITIEGDGTQSASINAQSGGMLLFAAPVVSNAGRISAPDGQVILAAGDNVYLAAPNTTQTGTNLRGLVVEVSNNTNAAGTVNTSTAENTPTGVVNVGHGNATMIGYAVNQNGLISAQTSVTENGSIYLYARDQAAEDSNNQISATRTGVLTLGPTSTTEVSVDLSSTATIPAGTAFNPSQVKLVGQSITMQPGAAIVAPGASVQVLAETLNQDSGLLPANPLTDPTRIDIGAGAVIDVSGSTGTVLPMSANVVQVSLRGTELADNPVLRASPIYGDTISVNVNTGTPIANIQGELGEMATTVGQRNITGGTVSLMSNSSIILRPGSEINVNGGSVNYAGGYLNTSQLQLGNSLVDVGSAKSGVAYTAVVTPPDSPANYVAGYTQGGSAGTVLLSSPILVMEGNLSGQVTRGPYQRDPSASNFPQGGTLQIGTQAGPWYGTFYTTASEFLPDGLVQLTSLNGAVPDAPAVGQSFNLNDAGQAQLASALQIDTAALNKAGFSNLAVTTTGNIQVNQAVNLAPGGGLSLTALTRPQRYADETGKQLPLGGQIDVTNSITVPSGKITLDAAAAANGPAGGATVTVAKGVVLSTAGTWTNDQVMASGGAATAGTPTSTVAVNGGSVTIAGELIQLGNDVTIDASAGAWRNQQGNTRLGSAGTITLQALPVDNLAADVQASGLTLGTGVSLLAYGFLNGGTLNLSTQSLLLGDVGGAQIGAGTLNLGSAFFQQGGFANYNLTAEESITLAAGAKVEPQQSNIALKPGVANMASSAMAKVDSVVTYGLSGANITRAATNLSLDAIGTNITSPAPVPPPASLSFQAGSTLTLDPGANLTIISGGAMDFESAINAPAGNVLISSQPSGANAPLLWFGSASSILVNGSAARLYTQPNGISTGNVLNAGSIRIGGPLTTYAGVQTLAPASGPVIMQAGAVFSAAGAGAGSQTLRNSNGEPVAQSNLGSNGGNIEIRSSSELQLAGAFNGTAGAGSQNGSLTLDLENTSGTFNVRQKYGTDGDESLATLASQTFSSFKATNGLGVVLTDNIDAGNFGQVYLRSQNALAFGLGNGNLTLSATKSVILDAPTLLSDSKALASDQAALLQAAMSTIEAQNSASHTVQTAAQVAAEAATLAAQNLPTSNVLLTTPATLTVDAPYVRLGDSSSSQTYYPAGGLASNANRPALAGNATLAVTAGTIDLLGNFATQGFSTTRLSATNDVRLVGVVEQDAKGNDTGYQNGSLWTLGTLQITSAQTYPTTLTDYLLVAGTAIDPNSTNNSILAGSGTVSFGPSGATPGPVPSAGGSLTVYATHIVQAGNLQAPFGEITLGNINSAVDANITNDLTYSAGSLTSVAGQGGIPFGIVANGSVPTASVWTATLNDGNSVTITQTPVSTPSNPERYLPTKAIVSQAANINVAKDATVDLAGGGSMFAYEFTPGKGGSTDVLNNNTTFAIMPAYSSKVAGTNNVAPVDSSNNNYGGQGGLQAGDSVWLSGMGNLPAGYYTLLPAHFALLPGAYAITAVSGTANMQATANAVEADGSMLMSGALSNNGSGIRQSQTQGFLVMSNAVVNTKSLFTLYDFNTYFSNKAQTAGRVPPQLPVDGGQLVLNATGGTANALQLNGMVNLAAASSGQAAGQAGVADIAVPNLEITSTSGPGTSNTVDLSVQQLNSLNARSLSIGGVRQFAIDGSGAETLTVASNTLTLANDVAHPLTAPELILSATNLLDIAPGAALRATGNVGTGLSDLKVANAGALLRASGQVQADPLRAGGPNSGGTLQVGSNAVLASAGSLSLDAGKGMQVNGSLDVDSSGTLSLYAPGINIGDLSQVSGNTTALGLSESLLPSFNSLSQLSLNGNGQPIYFWGNVTLGSSALKALNISSSGFVNGGGGNVSIQANTLNLTGSTGTPPTAINGDAGTLTVTAATIGVGSNTFALAGFADAALNASAKVMANGTAGVLSADQELDISTPLITGSSGSSASFVALGDMHLSQSSSPAAGTAAGLGVSLSFQAQDIYSNTNIFVPSGQISMSAVDSLKLTGGTVSAAGAVASFNGTSVATPGGAIVLSASDLEVESGATLNVSAMSAAAGSLQLAAQTNLLLQGTLVGNSTNPDGKTLSNLAQGQFQLSYAGAAPQDFGAFNDMLNSTTVGFTQSRSFRYGSGNVVLAGSDQIVANQVSIAVDNGNINIGGQAIINASGPEGGSISLYAAQPTASGSNGTITISGQALLQARGNSAQTGTGGTNGNGGTVLLSSGNTDGSAPLSVNGGASLNLLGGTIDVTGATGASNGSVTLRAPRTAGGTDLAVASINTQIVGSAQTVLEGYKVYQATSISEQPDSSTNSSINLDATTSGQMYQDATLFGNSAAAILSRLGAPTLEVRPGIEVQSSGNLTVSVNEFATNPADRGWNLDAWRFGGQPINLTLQAAGTLDIIGSISDGFVKSTNPKLSMPDWSLDTGASANLTLVGGADQHAARVTDTIAGAGDVVVQFAARTPDPGSATPIEVAGTNTVVAQNPNAPITATDEPVAVVRTGTGSISISSGRDVVLGMAPFYVFATADDTNGTPVIYDKQVQPNGFAVSLFGASIYTAGQATSASAPNFVLPQNALNTQFGGTGMSPASFASGGGAISINADRDIIGAQSTTAWYYRNSDGQPAATGTPVQLGTEVPLSQVVPQLVDNWLFRQGRTSVDANGNVSFEVLGASNAVLSAGDTLNTAWWVRTDYFDSGIATFAGGDLSINAGRNISNLYASAATDALAQTAGQAPTQWGGGNLQVVAGGNILGGQFYVQKGTMNIQAAGSLVQGLLEPSASVGTASTAFYPILALGDAQANVVAGGSLGIETVYNPTITEQSLFNQNLSGASPVYSPTSAFNPSDPRAGDRLTYAQFSDFLSYSTESAVNLMALSGDVLINGNTNGLASAAQWQIPNYLQQAAPLADFPLLYALMPGTLNAVAMNGDVVTNSSFVMSPSPTGQLSLLASGSIHLNNISNAPITMLDADPASLSTVAAPRLLSAVDMGILTGTGTNTLSAHALTGLHANDSQPVELVALNGDVTGTSSAVTTLNVPKPINVVAGRDIVDLGLTVQQDSASDVSTFYAGRDVLYTTQLNPSPVSVVVDGGGTFEVFADRNVDFGNSSGIVTRGNLDNSYLPSGGASLRVIAGTQNPDYAGFLGFFDSYGSSTIATSAQLVQLASFLALPTTINEGTVAGQQADYAYFQTLSATQQARFLAQATMPAGFNLNIHNLPNFAQWPDSLRTQLQTYIDGLGVRKDGAQLWAALNSLPAAQQKQFYSEEPALVANLNEIDLALKNDLSNHDVVELAKVFFANLIETGSLVQKDSNGNPINSSLKFFDTAIASLFPNAVSTAGDNISLFGSQLKTEQGGDITMYAPAGSMYAGLTLGYPNKPPSDQGIFTIQGGMISAFVAQDIHVNLGRIFTLDGGDIVLVSQYGSIDAGNGSKTATSAPPPVITIDANGHVQVDFSSSINGSGVATFQTNPDIPGGNVYAVAPRGAFDAGDAGVRSAGSVEIVANVVLNSNNISAVGSVTGALAPVATPSVPAAAPANVTTSKDDDVVKAATGASTGSNNLTVTVESLGFGEDCDDTTPDCASDNADPKKRKKAPEKN